MDKRKVALWVKNILGIGLILLGGYISFEGIAYVFLEGDGEGFEFLGFTLFSGTTDWGPAIVGLLVLALGIIMLAAKLKPREQILRET